MSVSDVLGAQSGSNNHNQENATDGARTAQEAGISVADARRIQNAANRTNQEIIVVGTRADGTAGPLSDWDYLMSGNRAQRHSASSSVPRGHGGGAITSSGRESGIDIWSTNRSSRSWVELESHLPHVIFRPR
jgi:hypothetical protein